MKREEKGWFFYVITGLMEFSWTFSIALLVTSWTPYVLPLNSGFITLFLALLRGRMGWFQYRWQVLLSHFLLFGSIILYHLYRTTGSSKPFYGLQWYTSLQDLSLENKLLLLVFLLFFFLLWYSGQALSQRATDFSTISSRFDLGCGVFFLLFIIETIVEHSIIRVLPTLTLFFFSSLLAMSLARETISIDSITPKRWTPILSQILILFLLVGIILPFLVPLKVYTDEGYMMFKEMVEPFKPILISILRFLFYGLGRSRAPTTQGIIEQEGVIPLLPEDAKRPVSRMISYTLYALIISVFILLIGFVLYRFWIWIRSSLQEEKREGSISLLFKRLIELYDRWRKRRSRPMTSTLLFSSLLTWGRRWRLSPTPGETPREFSHRLKRRFPFLGEEIESIIEGYYREVFGEIVVEEKDLRRQKKALQRVKNPLHWPKRILYSFRWYRG